MPTSAVLDTLRQDEPSTLQPAKDTPMPTIERGKSVVEEGYKTGSNINVGDLRMLEGGFTQLEVRLDGSTRTIAILMDLDLLKNTEDVLPSLGPLVSR